MPELRTCEYCGGELARNAKAVVRFCGAIECRRRWNREYMRRLNAAHRERDGQSLWSKRKRGGRPLPSCAGCGVMLSRSRSLIPRCRACHRERMTKDTQRQRRYTRVLRQMERAAVGTVGKRPWVSTRCERCGGSFLTNKPAKYCARRCKQRDTNARRRAAQAGVKITPGRRIAVFERDAWICQICGEPTDPVAAVPCWDAPTIDHRVPLARGGEHGPDNWQTAHFLCNSAKRDLVEAA